MAKSRERILLVESDLENCDLIARQTLQPLGFKVEIVGAASQAIQESIRFSPDVIIANLDLPGLSGKDLLVALSSQGVEVPVIVIAEKGMEADVIQAFRLGATDYLRSPVREAEVVSAVERILKQVRSRREKELLARQLNQTNQELQRRVRELTTIFAIGKAVTSITNQRALLDKVVEGAVYVTEADSGWLLLREDRGKSFVLSSYRNLPSSIANKLNQPWEDGISSLVALSGEALSIYGEPLKRFKVSRLGQSALVVPVKVRKEVVGLLVVVRKAPAPFGASNQTLLEAVADYASISLINAHLFKALEERARSLQQVADSAQVNERIKDEILQCLGREFFVPMESAKNTLEQASLQPVGSGNEALTDSLRSIRSSMNNLLGALENLKALEDNGNMQTTQIDLSRLARQAIARFQRLAHSGGISLITELPSRPVLVTANRSQLTRVFESLLSNAIKYSKDNGQVILHVEKILESGGSSAHAYVKDNGPGISAKAIPSLFKPSQKNGETNAVRFGGLGISLALVKEIILAHGGKIWVESEPGKGSVFHFTLKSHPE
jgi:signal transduction histidine kinase